MSEMFETHVVAEIGDVAPFANWLGQQAHDHTPLAVALRDRKKQLAFASRDDAWVVDLKGPARPLLISVLQTQVNSEQLRLTARNLSRDLVELTRFFGPLFGTGERSLFPLLKKMFVGDLTSAARCINQPVTPMAKFRKIEQDAFEIALLLPQYEYGIAKYYEAISIPLGKLLAETHMFGKTVAPAWHVVYNDLWLRVLAFYTGDPTLGRAFAEGADPVARVAATLEVERPEAELMLLWQACGRDLQTFVDRFKARLNDLQALDLSIASAKLDIKMPALGIGCAQMMQAYYESKRVTTRYSRFLRPGSPIGEAVAFRVFGTVEELISVAAVTFYEQEQGIMILRFEGGPAEDMVRIVGAGPGAKGMDEWLRILRAAAPLDNPLSSLALNPIVVSL